MHKIHKSVLVLNASYEPIAITAARDAMKKLCNDKVVVEEEYDMEFRPGLKVPSVIRLKVMIHLPPRLLQTTRPNIYARDHHECQYCGVKRSDKSLTLDHVIPRSKGGKSAWDNLVACCKKCNNFKADRTPEEAGMVLLHKPRPLTIHTSRQLLRISGLQEDEQWRKYIYA